MNVLRLKVNKFGCWVMVIGIRIYFWAQECDGSSVLDLAKEGYILVWIGVYMDEGDGFTKNLLNKQGRMQ